MKYKKNRENDKSVYFIRCNDVNPDPRVQKYVNFLGEREIPYKVLAWDRLDKGLKTSDSIIYYNKPCSFGGGEKNIIPKIGWMFFIFKNLWKYRKDYKVIHACDFDAAFPAIFLKLIHKTVIFDVFDWIDETVKPSFLLRIVYMVQKTVAKKSDYIIICEEYRRMQLKFKHDNILVMPNIPDVNVEAKNNSSLVDKVLKVGYVGVFDENRGIDLLMNIVSKNKNYELYIAGFGKLEKKVIEYSEKYNNIIFEGKVDRYRGLEILKKSDLIAAFYFTENCPVHIFAAPNKYYEALILGMPIITNKGTVFSKKVEEFDVGFTTFQNVQSISDELSMIYLNKQILRDKAVNARKIWKEKYSTVIDEFMNDKYIKIIK